MRRRVRRRAARGPDRPRRVREPGGDAVPADARPRDAPQIRRGGRLRARAARTAPRSGWGSRPPSTACERSNGEEQGRRARHRRAEQRRPDRPGGGGRGGARARRPRLHHRRRLGRRGRVPGRRRRLGRRLRHDQADLDEPLLRQHRGLDRAAGTSARPTPTGLRGRVRDDRRAREDRGARAGCACSTREKFPLALVPAGAAPRPRAAARRARACGGFPDALRRRRRCSVAPPRACRSSRRAGSRGAAPPAPRSRAVRRGSGPTRAASDGRSARTARGEGARSCSSPRPRASRRGAPAVGARASRRSRARGSTS